MKIFDLANRGESDNVANRVDPDNVAHNEPHFLDLPCWLFFKFAYIYLT